MGFVVPMNPSIRVPILKLNRHDSYSSMKMRPVNNKVSNRIIMQNTVLDRTNTNNTTTPIKKAKVLKLNSLDQKVIKTNEEIKQISNNKQVDYLFEETVNRYVDKVVNGTRLDI